MPLVSVIINIRNGAGTLREAMDSVLQQTFEDWELIVWDDRSTDCSAAIVAQYRDSRIRYFLSPKDVPLGTARNDAIRQATGTWIAFLDQDDLWLPHKLASQLALASNSVGLIYGRTVRFYPNGSERDYDFTHEYAFLPEGDIFTQLFTKSCFIAMSSAVFRRSAIEAVGGIPEEIQIIPDYYLYAAVTRKYEARAVQEVVCRYRMHPDSMSHVAAVAMNREALRMVESWADDLHPALLSLCQRRHHTAIAVEEIRARGTRSIGFMRLLSKGSIESQLVRPLAFVFHVIRRNLRPPYWKRLPDRPSV
jgi:glycosyltransferase involved in cell wall biosynthesis